MLSTVCTPGPPGKTGPLVRSWVKRTVRSKSAKCLTCRSGKPRLENRELSLVSWGPWTDGACMTTTRALILLLALLLSGLPSRADDEPTAWAKCADRLVLPRFSSASRVAGSGGPVTARFTIDEKGTAVRVEMAGGAEEHRSEIAIYLGESRFSRRCAGRRLELRFTFVESGGALLYPVSWVEFESPNHFLIWTRPLKPIIH